MTWVCAFVHAGCSITCSAQLLQMRSHGARHQAFLGSPTSGLGQLLFPCVHVASVRSALIAGPSSAPRPRAGRPYHTALGGTQEVFCSVLKEDRLSGAEVRKGQRPLPPS